MGGGKHAQGSRYDSANHPHAGCSLCGKTPSMNIRKPLAAGAFLTTAGQRNLGRHRIRISPEPVIRHGLSLARNSACATITRSTFLACTFITVRKYHVKPFDPALHRSSRFRSRSGAISSHDTRFPRVFPHYRGFDDLHSPLGHLGPLDQSVQPFQPRLAHLAGRPINLPLPAAPSCDSAADPCSGLASSRSANRSGGS